MADNSIQGNSPLYVIDYRTLSYISGPLLFVENVHNVGYNEIVELRGPDGQIRRDKCWR